MNFSEIRTAIQNSLQDEGVYRTAAQINVGINDGYLLVCLVAMCDERQANVLVTGSRNFNALPTTGNAYCFAPIAIVDKITGYRLSPCSVDQFDFYNQQWEGMVADGSLYYTLINQFESIRATLLTCPIQSFGQTYLTVYGAYIPEQLSADSDEPRFEAGFHDLLVHYGRFHGFLSEPGMGQKAVKEYALFTSRLVELIASIKARFPSGRDYEPWPIEFDYAGVTVQEQTVNPPEQQSNEG